MTTLQIPTAEVFEPLLSADHRFYAAYGGRGGGKSHFFADQTVEEHYSAPGLRTVCIREVQDTIKDSVKQLLEDKVRQFDLGGYFHPMGREIRTPGGGVILFRGMQEFNAENIKSLEGMDRAWVEEAQTLRARSLRLLRPTIMRKPGAKMRFGWNPDLDTDPVDNLFRGKVPLPRSVVVRCGIDDNPWASDELKAERDYDYEADAEMAAHVWGGDYQVVAEGAYFARLLAKAERQGRVGGDYYNPALPVYTAWDLGRSDYTAIWYVQTDGLRLWVINYFETSGEGPEEIVPRAITDLEQDLGYRYKEHYLPHDVQQRHWNERNRLDTLRDLRMRNIVFPKAGRDAAERRNAIRRLLKQTWFDDAAKPGVKRLRNFKRRFIKATETFGDELHDENSHGAHAFGELAMNIRLKPLVVVPHPPKSDRYERAQQRARSGMDAIY